MAAQKNGFYEIHAKDNRLGKESVQENQFLLQRFFRLANTIREDDDDFPSLISKLSNQLGTWREGKLKRILTACHFVHNNLPKFKEHALEYGHVDYAMITAIDHELAIVLPDEQPELLKEIDTSLVKIFTATTPHESLPTIGYVKRQLNRVLRAHQIKNPDLSETTPKQSLTMLPAPTPGITLLSAELDGIEALTLADRVERFADSNDCSHAEALTRLVNGETVLPRKIAVFGIGEFQPERELTVTDLHGVENLNSAQQALLNNCNIEYHNANEVAEQCHAKHDPTRNQRMLTILRDGTCRFPGCTIDAATCDIDHVINYEHGGWTTLSNLQALCRHHHNMKTDRRVRATMNRDGHVTWYHADGSLIATTKPQGLLPNIEGSQRGITTRHSKHKPSAQTPPTNNGLGRWGHTLHRHNQRRRDYRNARHKPPPIPITINEN